MTTKRGCNVIVLVSPPSECEKNAIVVRNEVLLCSAIDPVTLTFDLSTPNHVTSRTPQDHSLTKFEHFGIIHFRVMLRTNRQTNRRDSKILPTPTDIVGVGNNIMASHVDHLSTTVRHVQEKQVYDQKAHSHKYNVVARGLAIVSKA